MKLRLNIAGGSFTLALFGSLLCLAIAACVRLPHRTLSTTGQFAPATSLAESDSVPRVNINTATAEELEKLPGIGRGLAARVIAYRERFGRFRRVEHLIMVRGIGERRFRRLRPFITT
jgi:competence ComEA-like helix-hairpin-helix protein